MIYYNGRKPRYDVEQYFVLNENKSEDQPMYVINKIVVNNPKMYEFYYRICKDVELIKGF